VIVCIAVLAVMARADWRLLLWLWLAFEAL
jgi:hypothetical protein